LEYQEYLVRILNINIAILILPEWSAARVKMTVRRGGEVGTVPGVPGQVYVGGRRRGGIEY
jgi:hypothetical protein